MKDEKIFAQLIIERVKDNYKKIEIEVKSNFDQTKKYDSYKIPEKISIKKNASDFVLPQKQEKHNIPLENDIFAEIEIEGNDNLYKTDNISQAIKVDVVQEKKENSQDFERDEKRELFLEMRDIARTNNSAYFLNTRFYNKQVKHENSKIFYRQAQFMKDFEDNYDKIIPFSSYFPYYQSMNYEQLRTYFTWRTKVRQGNIENTSISYAFIYIYELLNNIGVDNAVDGLDKLVFFWESFKKFDMTIDKYLIKWIKDYYIYYELPNSFKDFLLKNELQGHYPDIAFYESENNCDFQHLCSISKYNIKKSAFYNDEKQLVMDCADFVISKLKNLLAKSSLEFDNLIFQTSKSKFEWVPFEGALFYQHLKQTNRQIIFSNDEVYTYNQNKCLRSIFIARDSGKQLLAYIFKQMEVVLRKVTNYKFKITANLNMINTETLLKLGALGISIEKVVTDATLEFYADRNKTVVTVDESALNKIRKESLQTQEKLSIPESDFEQITIFTDKNEDNILVVEKEDFKNDNEKSSLLETSMINNAETVLLKALDTSKDSEGIISIQQNLLTENDVWSSFKNSLSETELKAFAIILQSESDIKQFANENGLMIEVLIDSINEKAFDSIGDNVLEIDNSINIYDEYKEKIIYMLALDK